MNKKKREKIPLARNKMFRQYRVYWWCETRTFIVRDCTQKLVQKFFSPHTNHGSDWLNWGNCHVEMAIESDKPHLRHHGSFSVEPNAAISGNFACAASFSASSGQKQQQ